MASRRIVATEKSILEKDDHVGSSPPADQQTSTAPAVPTAVILKLLAFTFAMIVMPIGSYFLTVERVFKGNSTYAGALAAIMANVVLIAYVVVAMMEDQSEQDKSKKEGKKNR